jgi:type VII secretion-associated serine protease mycosin
MASMLIAAPPAMADSYRDRQWHLKALDVATAHRVSKGEGVTVAVIDTGVMAGHSDLAGNVLPGVDDTGEFTQGWKDIDGHGTAMAALIAAHGHGSGDGALGIAPKAKILPIQVNRAKLTETGLLGPAVNEAVRRGAKVISMSLGAHNDEALERAVQEALKAGVIVVGAMGNRPGALYAGYPAGYPGVVAVGATGRNGKVAPVSVTGKEMVLAAPGVDIVSADRGGGYRIGTGTSDSTAIVAGAAALVWSKYPELNATQVIHRLTATARDEGAPGRDPQYGFGRLDLVAALTAEVNPADAKPLGPVTDARVTPAQPSTAPPAAAPPVDVDYEPKLSPLGYAVIGFLVVATVAGVVLLVWLLARRRRPPRQQPPAHFPHHVPGPPGYGYPPPGPVPPADHPQAFGPPGYGPPSRPTRGDTP